MRRFWPALLLAPLVLVAVCRRPESRTSRFPPTDARTLAPLPEPERPRNAPFPTAGRSSTLPRLSANPDADPVDVEPAPLRWLARQQNEDGSWGEGTTSMGGALVGRPGMTGLALLSLLGAGYSHLSKETVEGVSLGATVRRGLQALMADMRDDGLLRSSRGGLDQALAALALSEAYGLTGSKLFQARARAAVGALAALQIQDGSWGDATTTAWAQDALHAAEIAGLEFPKAAVHALLAHYDRRGAPDVPEMLARIQIEKDKKHPAVRAAAESLKASPPGPGLALHEIHVRLRAAFQFDGPAGPVWKAWDEPCKKAVQSARAPEGRSERIVHESLAALCLEICYRYTPVFGAK